HFPLPRPRTVAFVRRSIRGRYRSFGSRWNAPRERGVAALMCLTLPGAPLSGRPAGVFNGEMRAPEPLLYFEPTPKRIRVEFGGEMVADTTGAHLLFETGVLPVYYIPE